MGERRGDLGELDLLERWHRAERAALSAERFVVRAELGAAAASRMVTKAAQHAETSIRHLREAHDRYHEYMTERGTG